MPLDTPVVITVDPEHEGRLLASDIVELPWEKYRNLHKVSRLHEASCPPLSWGASAKPLGGLLSSPQACVSHAETVLWGCTVWGVLFASLS